jgi:hypothetical protein
VQIYLSRSTSDKWKKAGVAQPALNRHPELPFALSQVREEGVLTISPFQRKSASQSKNANGMSTGNPKISTSFMVLLFTLTE